MEVDVMEVTLTLGWPGAETEIGRVSIKCTEGSVCIHTFIQHTP